MTLDDVNALSRERFEQALGSVFEHSPWIAAAAYASRPFASVDALHAAMTQAMREAPDGAKLALLRAHPELAGKAAVAGELTASSTTEQAGAGLLQCSRDELERLQQLNRAYGERFGFPFIIAVKGLDRRAVIDALAARSTRDRDSELEEALRQVERIARLRLDALIPT